MNALNAQVQDEIAAAAAQVTADHDVRAVIIYGGAKVFAAGADIKEMAEASYAQMAADTRRLQDAFTRVAEIPLGVIPGAGGTQRLPRLVGPARAKDIVYTGRFVTAPEALAIGLVDKVVPDAEVYQAAREMVNRYAGGPAVALRAAKQAIDEGLDVDLDSGLEIERLNFAGLFATEDQRTGMRSFVENGPGKATFAGR